MSIKIFDCFIFYNELDLLLYRLSILDCQVDYFVIVEATHTFIGKEKNLIFNENKGLFQQFMHKIIHIIVEDLPYKYPNIDCTKNQQWINEHFQRSAISRGLDLITILDDDIIILSDLDEIPDPSILSNIRDGSISIFINSLEMDMYYYNLNTKYNEKWALAKIVSYYAYKGLNNECQTIRTLNTPTIKRGGWHLSYFGDSRFIKNKIINFSHQEFNTDSFTDILQIEKRVQDSSDLFDRHSNFEHIDIDNNTYLPPEYNTHLKKYVKLNI